MTDVTSNQEVVAADATAAGEALNKLAKDIRSEAEATNSEATDAPAQG